MFRSPGMPVIALDWSRLSRYSRKCDDDMLRELNILATSVDEVGNSNERSVLEWLAMAKKFLHMVFPVRFTRADKRPRRT